jgi:hypothetical protein
MHRGRVKRIDGRVKRTSDVEEVRRFVISPDYRFELYSGREIGDTGRLDIGALVPILRADQSLPRFGIRWDEGDSAIDVDAFNCTDEERRLFLTNAPGYSGHHTTLLDHRDRIVEWKLVWKHECLYYGQIKCPVVRVDQESVALDALLVARVRCRTCGNEFQDHEWEDQCPNCRSSDTH